MGFYPAAEVDEQALLALIPESTADSAIPQVLPARFVNVRPALKLDGVEVATGPAVTFGTGETFVMRFSAPGAGPQEVSNNIEAGEFFAVGLDLLRISNSQMNKLRAAIIATDQALAAGTDIESDQLRSDMFAACVTTWFRLVDEVKQISYRTRHVAAARYPSAGLFFSDSFVVKLFGVPWTVHSNGLAMDIDRNLSVSEARDGDPLKVAQATLFQGLVASALESIVPKSFFADPTQPSTALAATDILGLANAQGIPVYSIDRTNFSSLSGQLQISGEDLRDIGDATNAGQVVIVPQRPIAAAGRSIIGYAVLDPNSGAGDYIVGQSLNGGVLLAIATHFGTIAAAMFDTATGRPNDFIRVLGGDIDLAARIRSLGRFGNAFAAVGFLNSLIEILLNDQLSWNQMLGQISTLILSMAMGMLLTTLILTNFVGIGAILLLIVASIALAGLQELVNCLLGFSPADQCNPTSQAEHRRIKGERARLILEKGDQIVLMGIPRGREEKGVYDYSGRALSGLG